MHLRQAYGHFLALRPSYAFTPPELTCFIDPKMAEIRQRYALQAAKLWLNSQSRSSQAGRPLGFSLLNAGLPTGKNSKSCVCFQHEEFSLNPLIRSRSAGWCSLFFRVCRSISKLWPDCDANILSTLYPYHLANQYPYPVPNTQRNQRAEFSPNP